MSENTDRGYYVIIEDGFLLLVEITPERQAIIDTECGGDLKVYFMNFLVEEFDILTKMCEWGVTYESQIICSGVFPRITNTFNDDE